MSDLTGEVIDGRYQLTRLIASGGMASIYAGLDLRLDRHVAVKIMHPHLAQDEQFVNRFIREAKAAAALTHPNVVAVQDQGWNQGGTPAVFIVMELVEGNTLRDYLYEQGSLTVEQSLSIMMPVVSALSAAHKLGIIHRDVKPENILISNDGRVKIADFGLARGALIGTTMTAESSTILGSVSYLSPEQVQRGIADARSDVYAVGIVLFEILTGQKPFQGDDPVQVAFQHVNERVPAPSTLKNSIPIEIDQLVLHATSTNPDQRPKDAEELLGLMRAISEKLDPRRKQLSLELDLPPLAPTSKKSSEKFRRKKNQVGAVKDSLPAMSEKNEQSGQIHKKKASSRIRRNRKIALSLALTVGVIGWYLLLGPGSKISIPSVVGLSITEAKSTLAAIGLTAQVKEEIFSEDIEEGKIITSQPSGGGRIDSGGTVFLQLSKGKERYSIPTLQGLTKKAATQQIIANNLLLGEIVEEFSSDIPKGYVLRSSPVPGERVKRDSSINLVISKGFEQVDALSFIDKSGEEALNTLSDVGFNVTTKYAYDENILAGLVISQKPSGGTSLDKGSKITLTLSKGSEYVYVPNVYSLTTEKAKKLLEDLNLKVVVKQIGTKTVKTVTNIAPKIGSKVKRGSTVTITVG